MRCVSLFLSFDASTMFDLRSSDPGYFAPPQ